MRWTVTEIVAGVAYASGYGLAVLLAALTGRGDCEFECLVLYGVVLHGLLTARRLAGPRPT